jgi:hypothetical protein
MVFKIYFRRQRNNGAGDMATRIRQQEANPRGDLNGPCPLAEGSVVGELIIWYAFEAVIHETPVEGAVYGFSDDVNM